MVDTNCDPNKVDFSIPANDDATKSIAIIVNYITAAIAEGLAERQAAKDEDVEDNYADDNEKQAAKLQAEAEAEGGRGGRNRGEGGGAPRKRTTSGGGGARGGARR